MASDVAARLDGLASWSTWVPFGDALVSAPRVPGVYIAREGHDGNIVYIGMAGERRGAGVRGRLAVYASGKGISTGLGEAVFDRALADEHWLAARLNEVQQNKARRAKEWGRLAFDRADLHVRWATTATRADAVVLERECITSLVDELLWNRRR